MIQASAFVSRVGELLPQQGYINPSLVSLNFKSTNVPKGGEILSAGTIGRQVVTIGDGIAMRYRLLPDGGRQIIMFLMPGDVCSPHIYPTMMDHSVAAVTPVRVDRFECEALIGLTNVIVGLNQALWILAEQQNAIMRDHITSLGRGDTRLRVAMLLIEMVKRLRVKGRNGPFLIPVTQSLMADAVGVTHIHFNRILGEMSRRNIVETCRGSVVVKDLAWLERLTTEFTCDA